MSRGAFPGAGARFAAALAMAAAGCAAAGSPGGDGPPPAPTPSRDDRPIAEEAAGLVGIASPPDAPAPDGPLRISLEQAVLLALRNNRDLEVERFGPVVAGAFEAVERGVFDPEAFGRAEWNDEIASETDRATGARFDVEGRDTEVSVGARKRFPTGTTVEASVSHAREASDRAPEQQEARVDLTVTQAILRGRGSGVNLARVRIAETGTEISLHELRRATEAILADAEVAYWELVQAREAIAIFEGSLAVARKQSEEADRRIAVGILAETEAAAARAEVARREQALLDARSDLESRRLLLLRRLGGGGDRPFDRAVEATTSPRVVGPPIADLPDRLRLAEERRPDLAEARARLEQGELEVVLTRDGLLPRLDLFVALGKTGFEDTETGAFRELGGRTREVSVGLVFSHFLGARAAGGRERAARASRLQAAAAVRNLREQVLLEVRLAVNEAERARANIAATRTTREWQERTAEAEKHLFDVGTGTSLRVAQAQRDLLAAQIDEVEAVVRYRIALVRLYLAEGSLLERRGVSVRRPGGE
jgi:outer membrane protein TolC